VGSFLPSGVFLAPEQIGAEFFPVFSPHWRYSIGFPEMHGRGPARSDLALLDLVRDDTPSDHPFIHLLN